MLARAATGGAVEGDWLVADRQTAGRGRSGRNWDSPPGNLFASGLVRMRDGDLAAPTLALVAGVAVWDTLRHSREGRNPASTWTPKKLDPRLRGGDEEGGAGCDMLLKWPNDLLVEGAKLAGILLERQGEHVVVGVGVNVVHNPDLPDRPTTSLAKLGITTNAQALADMLAVSFAHWLGIWRDSLAAIRTAWLDRAHPVGTPLAATSPDGTRTEGRFDGLTADCALRLALPGGSERVIHAGDVFML